MFVLYSNRRLKASLLVQAQTDGGGASAAAAADEPIAEAAAADEEAAAAAESGDISEVVGDAGLKRLGLLVARLLVRLGVSADLLGTSEGLEEAEALLEAQLTPESMAARGDGDGDAARAVVGADEPDEEGDIVGMFGATARGGGGV